MRYPGLPGDLIQRRVKTVLGEYGPGGLDDGGPVAGGVYSELHSSCNLPEVGAIPHFR